jgi:hypothetical protein
MSKLIAVWLVIMLQVDLELQILVFPIQRENIVDHIFDKKVPV